MIHLDTNIVIAFLNGNKSVTERMLEVIDEIMAQRHQGTQKGISKSSINSSIW